MWAGPRYKCTRLDENILRSDESAREYIRVIRLDGSRERMGIVKSVTMGACRRSKVLHGVHNNFVPYYTKLLP